jgi:hypothetical protein
MSDRKYIINVNGVEREMTDDEKQLKDQLLADVEKIKNERQAKLEKENTDKASGKQKLKDLGLNDDEIQALMGV